MSPDLLRRLRDDILSGPRRLVLQPLWLAGRDADVAADYAAAGGPGPRRGAFLTERGVLHVLGPMAGDQALAGIEAAAEAPGPLRSLLARCVRILRDYAGEGLDMGDPGTQQMLDALRAAGVLTDDAAGALKAYGTRAWTRAELLLGEGAAVTAADVARARQL